MKGKLFTPKRVEDGKRIRIFISEDIPKGKWQLTVTDVKTGKRYKAKSSPCGLGCYCDAIIYDYKR